MADKYVDIDTLKYMLYDVHNLEEMLSRERFQDHDKESLDLFIDATKSFADKELFPYIQEMDEKPAYHNDGKVFVHDQVKTMMEEGGDLGVISGPFDYEDGGMQIPLLAQTASNYILDAANNHKERQN
jgi:butyryl-CoA dehydrogenase